MPGHFFCFPLQISKNFSSTRRPQVQQKVAMSQPQIVYTFDFRFSMSIARFSSETKHRSCLIQFLNVCKHSKL